MEHRPTAPNCRYWTGDRAPVDQYGTCTHPDCIGGQIPMAQTPKDIVVNVKPRGPRHVRVIAAVILGSLALAVASGAVALAALAVRFVAGG